MYYYNKAYTLNLVYGQILIVNVLMFLIEKSNKIVGWCPHSVVYNVFRHIYLHTHTTK